MALIGSNAIVIKATTSSSTGSYRDISQYVTEFSGINFEAMLQETQAFGDSWKEQSFVGMYTQGDITLKGPYDDVAGGLVDTFTTGGLAVVGAERVIKVNMGTTNAYPKTDVIVKSISREPGVGKLSDFTVVLAPTGALTIATT